MSLREPTKRYLDRGCRAPRWASHNLAEAFKKGIDSLQATGPNVSRSAGNARFLPSRQQGLAYLTPATVMENVWEEIMGERLTIAHHFPRNADQRDTLRELVEQSFRRFLVAEDVIGAS